MDAKIGPEGSLTKVILREHPEDDGLLDLVLQNSELGTLQASLYAVSSYDITKLTFGGYSVLSEQIIDWSSPEIIGSMLKINAGAYSFEAGNVRHEHEWAVWKDTKLPSDKLILPGVVSHATNVVEHPDLVAERIGRFTRLVGKERVIASTDCGLGGRVHRDIAWAKLETLAQGTAIASKQT